MRLNRVKQDDREPIGIVIADGSRGDAVPRFAAFVWGPVPEEEVTRVTERELVAAS